MMIILLHLSYCGKFVFSEGINCYVCSNCGDSTGTSTACSGDVSCSKVAAGDGEYFQKFSTTFLPRLHAMQSTVTIFLGL